METVYIDRIGGQYEAWIYSEGERCTIGRRGRLVELKAVVKVLNPRMQIKWVELLPSSFYGHDTQV